MNEKRLLQLIADANEAERLENWAPIVDQREACLSMTRLRWIATAERGATAAESAHFRACAICSGRLAAWRGQRRRGNGRRVLHAVVQTGAVAAAVALMLLMRPANRVAAPEAPELVGVVGPAQASMGAISPVQLTYLPGVQPCDERVDQFCPTAREECVLMAVFRAWREECGCMEWELHRWDNGDVVVQAEPGDAPPINRHVTGTPPVQQVLILAVASRSSQLPGADEADDLIDCLNASDVSTWEGGAENYSTAVAGCLPDSVTIVPQAFVVNCD
ncbi:MAG: hypothetical protein KDA32_03775 [Phycisphaerales bacterium]|nr:hypothetical protein [Phycisphaerales bacterium]